MYLNYGTNSYISGFLQAFLKENFDETVEVSNIYNKNTHKTLLEYLQFPEVKTIQEVIDNIKDFEITIGASTYTLEYLFTIQNNIDNITLRSKSTYEEGDDLEAISNGLFELKSLVYDYGWTLIYYRDDNNRFISHITPINITEHFPRKDICSMVNMAGLDYIDNYYIKNTSNPSITVQTENIGIYTTIIDRSSASIKEIKANEPICDTEDCKKLPNLLHTYLKTPVDEHGFGDESEFFNGTSFRFKLGGSTEGITNCSYIDSKNNVYDMSEYSATSDITDILKTTFTSTVSYTDLIIQVFLVPNKKRIYFITGIEDGKYYALAHPYDFSVNVKYVFSSEEMSSKKIREQFDPHLMTAAEEISLNKGEVAIIKSPEDPTTKVSSLLVSINVPVYTKKENYEVGARLMYGDLNGDEILNESDIHLINEKNTALVNYSYTQRLAMKSKKGLDERTADYTKITIITAQQIQDALNRINMNEPYTSANEEYLYAPVPVETKPIYLYVGRVSDWLVNRITKDGVPTYPAGQTMETEIVKSFKNLNFYENPFLVHSKFIDYLLDSSIDKYSEEHRINWLYELFGYDEPYDGYTEELQKTIYDYQRNEALNFNAGKVITFTTGYPDVETLYAIREGT